MPDTPPTPWLDGLTAAQRDAVTHTAGPCLVVAGAGTGKTTVITRRIGYLIQELGVDPERILALTFTDKAATEMEERVDLLLPYGVVGTTIATFHSFCAEILRRHAQFLGVKRDFPILSTADEISLLRRQIDSLPETTLVRPHRNSTEPLKLLVQFMHKAKEEILTPEVILEHTDAEIAALTRAGLDIDDEEAERERLAIQREYALLYQAAVGIYQEANVLSYADLTAQTVTLFREHPSVRRQEAECFDYLLVDEFQDTNAAQNEIVRLLAGTRANLQVVGDDDQAIYAFRGASLGNILSFSDHYPGRRLVTLTENYRSRQPILDAAYRLIQANNPERLEVKERISKRLLSQVADEMGEGGGVVTSRHFVHGAFEHQAIAQEVGDLLAAGTYAPEDIAILTRAKSHANGVIAALRAAGVPYQQVADTRFFSQPAVRIAVTYLRTLAYPHQNHTLHAYLCQPPFSVSVASASKLLQEAQYRGVSLFDYLATVAEAEGTAPEVGAAYRFLNAELEIARDELPSALLLRFLHATPWYREAIDRGDQELTDQVATLHQEVQRYEQLHPDARIVSYIDHVDRLIDTDEEVSVSSVQGGSSGAVQVMTVHRSKGLEFAVVFLPSLVLGRFPSRNYRDSFPFPYELTSYATGEEGNLAEERRLMYVAMTRAKERLILSWSDLYEDQKTRKKLSPFVIEALGDSVVQLPAEGGGEAGILPARPAEVSTEHTEPLLASNRPDQTAPNESSLTLNRRLSPSALEDYLQCPWRFRYRYLLNVQVERRASSNYGLSIHAALKEYFEARTRGELLDIEPVLRRCWVAGGYDTARQEARAFSAAAEKITAYVDSQASATPLHLEYPIRLRLPDGTELGGIIDRIDTDGNGTKCVRLIDYKTGESTVSPRELSRSLATGLYAVALEQAGLSVSSIELHYVGLNHVVQIPGEAIDRKSLITQASETVAAITASCSSDRFPNQPDPFACGMCDFRDLCVFRHGTIH